VIAGSIDDCLAKQLSDDFITLLNEKEVKMSYLAQYLC